MDPRRRTESERGSRSRHRRTVLVDDRTNSRELSISAHRRVFGLTLKAANSRRAGELAGEVSLRTAIEFDHLMAAMFFREFFADFERLQSGVRPLPTASA